MPEDSNSGDKKLISEHESKNLVFSKQDIWFRRVRMLRRLTRNENGPKEYIYSRILLLKEKADVYFDLEEHDSALEYYRDIFNIALRGQDPLSNSFYNERYLDMLHADKKSAHRFPMFLTLVQCCIHTAEIYRKREDYISAIDWLQEVEVLYECVKKVYPESHSGFVKLQKTLEFVTYHMEAALQLVRVFSYLRNTSSAAFFASLCTERYPQRFPPDIEEIRELRQKCDAPSLFNIRHPDPTRLSTWDVTDPSLQIRGVWTKLIPRSSVRPKKRHHRATWIWRNNIYIAFGIVDRDYAFNGDLWCIDTNEMGRWRHLPEIPQKLRKLCPYGDKVILFEDHAWFFSGNLEILRFDMITETWDKVVTHADFPIPHESLRRFDSYVSLYEDKLCVFGGFYDFKVLRKQIFLLLDLRSLRWENLNKNITPDEEARVPSPRYCSMIWISAKERRLFLMYGSEEEMFYTESTENTSTPERTDLYELWSYGFSEKAWTRERLRGNFPCHRMDAIYVYDEKKDRLILFGGGAQGVPSLSVYAIDGITRDLPFSMFADTFVLDLKTRIWSQVITRNFPAWRSTTKLLLNDDGNIFLQGGMSFRNIHLGEYDGMKFYSFSDTWRLDIESPETIFDEMSFSTQSLLFKAGCWRQCCVCQSIGTGYFQCEGSCKLRRKFVYCSAACQRSSRQTHKVIHGCRRMFIRDIG